MSEPGPTSPHSIADWIRGYEEGGTLRGFRCAACGHVAATWGLACVRCGARELREVTLADRGRVVAFTILNVPGDEFVNDAPYAYVVVELDGGGRVTGWMPGIRAEGDLALGDRVRFRPSYRPGVQFTNEGDGPPGG